MNPIDIILNYYDEHSEAFRCLITHSEMVRDKAISILDKHPELDADRQFILEASMLHDIGIVFTNAPAIGCFGKWTYICHGHLGAELLRKEGFPMHAKVCERHTGTGLTREEIVNQNIPIPPSRYVPETIEEIIICYADKFFSKGELTRELTVDEIEKRLAKYGQQKVNIFMDWNKQFS